MVDWLRMAMYGLLLSNLVGYCPISGFVVCQLCMHVGVCLYVHACREDERMWLSVPTTVIHGLGDS